MTQNDIIKIVHEIKKIDILSKYKYGLAGSFARGDATKDSDIDIVVNSDGLSIDILNIIKGFFHDVEADILCLGLLKKEDEELDKFLTNMGLPINDESIYKTVRNEVIWIE